ncbi:lantibiotic dehydratase [Streptomyces sp. KN37]|uniref:lantibiotic dehydratase n=1 Tax=Streptomyces sp. KN37 TaxID=3090667 RepID=UPI002A75A8BD|nr:lantibiotic dehydratase [Streptomyces sp. KN37]WPO69768.1 lantibiotic dehydratase [Streptomyces sp. KN37]
MDTFSCATYIVRVPAFPADAVDALRSPLAADGLRRCRDAADAVRLQAARCSDILYDAVAALPPGRDRSALLDLRRSLHNGRAARARRLAEKLVPLLPPAAEQAVREWDRLMVKAEHIRRTTEQIWDGEADRSMTAAVRTARLPAISLELCRSASPLAAVLERAETGLRRGTAPDIDTALSAYAFVVRACLKSTPRGSLSAWAHGVLLDEHLAGRPRPPQSVDRWDGDPRPRAHHAELNAFITLTLLRQLTPNTRLVVNPSTVASDGSLYAITPNCDAVRRIRADSALRELIAVWPTGGRGAADAIQALSEATGADPARAQRALTRLIDVGLLVSADETPLHDPAPLRTAARRTGVSEDTAAILTEVADAADALTGPDADAAVPALARTLNTVSHRLSWPSHALRYGAPAYADTVLTAGQLTLDAATWAPLYDSLRTLAGWIGHADPWSAPRKRAESHLAEVFGSDHPVPLTVALHELVRAAGSGVPGMRELWSDEFRLPPADDPGLAGLRQLLTSTPTTDGVLRIDSLPKAPDRPDSLTSRLAFYGHPVRQKGQPLFVVNSVEDGCGRADAHVQRILDRIGLDTEQRRTWPDSRPTPLHDTVDVEIGAVADSNVNLRVLGALPELAVSQGMSSHGPSTGSERIDARECRVVLGQGRMILTHHNKRLRVVPRGRMADFHYPPVLRLLLRMFGPSPEHRVQPVIAPEGRLTDAGCRVVPRVDLGGVVLLRRTVIVESDQVPRRATGESLLGYAERIDAWRRQCTIPAWSYLRAVNGSGADKHRKPMPIDLHSPLGIVQIERMTRRDARRLLFQEVLPDAVHAPMADDGSRWLAEVVWEVTPRNDGHG